VGFWSERKPGFPKVFFPSEYDSGWSKEHGRLERWRLQRVAVTPEESGLCGCWQFIAVWRERQKLRRGKVVEASEEYSLYVSSLVIDEHNAPEVAQFIRGHWGACENGSHYRRDVTLGEDASQVSGRNAAQAMATLRNLVLGLFELQKEQGKANAEHVPSWLRRMRAPHAIQLITKGG
jgi:predicted transposase YbfD/YdcC